MSDQYLLEIVIDWTNYLTQKGLLYLRLRVAPKTEVVWMHLQRSQGPNTDSSHVRLIGLPSVFQYSNVSLIVKTIYVHTLGFSFAKLVLVREMETILKIQIFSF